MKALCLPKIIESLRFLPYFLIFSAIVGGALSCSSDDKNEDPPEETFVATSSFKLTGDGYDETITYNSDDNLIFCRLTGNDMWIRLARDKAANGENSSHIDIDICNYAGAGTYSPVDPQNRPCPAGLLWDIFWHDGDKVYSNKEDSSPCQLTLSLDGDVLTGVFNCSEVIRFQGTETIEITEGTFTCKME